MKQFLSITMLWVAMLAISQNSFAQFSGDYDPANWTTTNSNSNGSVDASGAPASIIINGSDNGSGNTGYIDYLVTVTSSGTLSFNWNCNHPDPAWDNFEYSLNGVVTLITDQNTAGSTSFPVLAGDLFSFRITSDDNNFGGPSVTISNFMVGAPPPAPANDDCASAIPITPAFSCVATAGTSVLATEQFAPSTCSGFTSSAAYDVWYSFVADGTSAYNVSMTGTGGMDGIIGLYSACSAGNLITCSDATVGNGTESISAGVLTAGTYYYRIYGWAGSTGTFTTCVTIPPAPPVNDQCTGVTPTVLASGVPVVFNGTTAGATTVNDQGYNIYPTVWEAVTVTAPCNNIVVEYCGTAAGTMTTFWINMATACPPVTSTPVGTWDVTACGDGNGTIYYDAMPAGTYYIPVLADYPGNTPGPYTLTVTSTDCPPPPANDLCAGAIPITCGQAIPGTTILAGDDIALAQAPDCAGGGTTSAGVWYTITGTGSSITLNTCPNLYDTQLAVYSGTCGALTCEGYNDDFCGLGSQVTLNTVAGNTYYILVYGYNGATGNFTLNASCNGLWTGNTSTDWFTASNWSSNSVPVAFENVIIPDVSGGSNTYPVIMTPVTVTNLTVNAGASVDVDPSAGLIIDGTLDASSGSFTLQSSASGTAYLDDFTFGGTVVGSINVQRFNPIGVTGYRQLGTPVAISNMSSVSGFTVSGVPGFVIPLPTCDPNYVASNSPYGSWVQLVENAAPQYSCSQSLFQVLTGGGMTNGRGYYMDAPGASTFIFSGAPNTGPVSFGLTHANPAVSNGWNMVSNPYPSPLAWETGNVPTGIDGIAKLWVTSGTYTGTFQDIDPNVAGTAVAIGQAFQVRVTNPGDTPNFDVDNSDRTTSPPTYLFAGNAPMTLNIDILGNGFADLTKVRFIDGATTNMDAMFDSPKMLGNANQPMIYSVWNSKNYSTNSYASMNDVYTLPLGVKIAAAGQHTLSFSNIDQFPPSAFIYLEDVQTGTMHDVRANDTYNFTQSVGVNENRFILHFFPPVEKNVTDATCELNGSVVLTENAPATWDYVLENAQNVTVSQGILDVSQSIPNLPAGIYTLTMTEQTSGYVAVETVTITGAFQVSAVAEVNVVNPEAGQEIQFTANTQNATAWSWNFGDGNTSIEQNPLHIFNAAGNYSVVLTASNTTCDDISSINVAVSAGTSGIEDAMADAGVKMWNTNTTVYLDFKEIWTGKTVFSLYDASGKLIFTKQMMDVHGLQNIQCGELAAGTYTIQLKGNNKTASRKAMMGIK